MADIQIFSESFDGLGAVRSYGTSWDLSTGIVTNYEDGEVVETILPTHGIVRPKQSCHVYWGSHGCDLGRGHEGMCVCLSCWDPGDEEGYVGAFPYYGPETTFYSAGEDEQSVKVQTDRFTTALTPADEMPVRCDAEHRRLVRLAEELVVPIER